jgi:hypothetical protein
MTTLRQNNTTSSSVPSTATKRSRTRRVMNSATVARTLESAIQLKKDFLVRSIPLQNVLDQWARTGGVISRHEALIWYNSKMLGRHAQGHPMQSEKVAEFIVQRFLQTRGKRLARGVYQLVTSSHLNLGVRPESVQNKNGVMVPSV